MNLKSSFNLKMKIRRSCTKLFMVKTTARFHFTISMKDLNTQPPAWGAISNAVPADYLAFNAVLSSHGIQGSSVGTVLRRLPMQFVEKLDKKH